jgi:hypothetical protein
MIDMMSRTPGPRNWVLWPVFLGQLAAGAIATGALASAAATFASYFVPSIDRFLLGWTITAAVIAIVWAGEFRILKILMSILVGIIVIGVFDVAYATWPGWGEVLVGMFGFQVPEIPDWARAADAEIGTAWDEILPLLGWAAGGFASQVWYTYWVLGAGYGMAQGREYGQPLDESRLRNLGAEEAETLRGWRRVVVFDATFAMVVGMVVTIAFAISGAMVLRVAEVAPEGPDVALALSKIFGARWGEVGAHLYVLAGLAALVSTLLGQFAGWPRLLADCARILIPGVARFSWKTQFRTILVIYALSNMVLVYSLGMKPVFLVKFSAVVEGLLLTPLQALAVGLVLYLVMPKLFSEKVGKMLKPHPIYAVWLAIAFVVFTGFCVFQVPAVLFK